jgi:hypothetical protein
MGALKNLTKWQNYLHYLLLAVILNYAVNKITTSSQFLILLVGLFIADTIVHFLFSVAPGKIRWSD